MDVREKQSSEKRLIDADAFLEKMKRTSRYFDVVFDVEEMPTVDAVEVIRCRDCEHYKWIPNFGRPMCTNFRGLAIAKPDDFCPYGEQKEGAE